MKVGVALCENDRIARIHENFGRCAWFGIYDSASGDLKFIANSDQEQAGHAGIRAAQMLVAEGVQIAVAGRFGANVMDFLEKHKVRMVVTELPRNLDDILRNIK